MSKRKFQDTQFGLDDDGAVELHIVVAGRTAPIITDWNTFFCTSGLLKALPRQAADEPVIWNISEVVLQGEVQPVSAGIVEAWVEISHALLDGTLRGQPLSSLHDFVRLLRFADYAQTCDAVISRAVTKFVENRSVFVEVSVGASKEMLRLRLHDSLYFSTGKGVAEVTLRKKDSKSLLVALSSNASALENSIREAVSTNLEEALYLAARLEQLPLIRLLETFIKNQHMVSPVSMTYLDYRIIYSCRVLENMPKEMLYSAYVRSSLSSSEILFDIRSHDVEVVYMSKLSALFQDQKVGVPVRGNLQDGRVTLRTNPRYFFVLHTTCGGPTVEEREMLVKQIMDNFTERSHS